MVFKSQKEEKDLGKSNQKGKESRYSFIKEIEV